MVEGFLLPAIVPFKLGYYRSQLLQNTIQAKLSTLDTVWKDWIELEVDSESYLEEVLVDVEEEMKVLADESEPYVIGMVETVKEATITPDFDSALAIAGADTFAGFVTNVIFRFFLGIKTGSGDENRREGIYYTSRGLFRGAFVMTGIPDPFDILLGSILAQYFTNLVYKHFKGGQEQGIEQTEESIDSAASIASVVKWIAFSKLVKSAGISGDVFVDGLHYFEFGLVAATVGYGVKLILNSPKIETNVVDFGKYELHGGLLFLCFEEFRTILHRVIPNTLNIVPPINDLVNIFEEDLAKLL